MGAISDEHVRELRASLLELSEVCPFDQCNPPDCPLYLLRKLKRDQRLAWFNALSAEDLSYLATYHHICLGIKLNGQSVDKDHD